MKLVPVGSVVWEVLAFWALCLADGRAQGWLLCPGAAVCYNDRQGERGEPAIVIPQF